MPDAVYRRVSTERGKRTGGIDERLSRYRDGTEVPFRPAVRGRHVNNTRIRP